MLDYGDSLKYQREVAGLNKTELAKAIGTSHQNISRWERNEVLPNIDFCVKALQIFTVSQ